MTDANHGLMERVERLEAECEARRTLARYFRLCDDLGPHTPLDELGDLFTETARWEGKGRYKAAFGAYEGRAAIVAMIASYCAPASHFVMTSHFLSSESISATPDTARGGWLMLQCSTYFDGRADLRSAAIEVDFQRHSGRWQISHFRSTNLFSRRVDRWSDDAPIGATRSGGPIPIARRNRATAATRAA